MRKIAGLFLSVLLFLTVAETAGAVAVRFSGELGKTSEAAMRPKALDASLSAAVSSVVARHTDAGQRAELSSQLKAILSKSRSFVTRYSVENEEVVDGVFYVRYLADVDREALFAALEAAGFKVFRLDALPRVLVAAAGAGLSMNAAKATVELFRAEGIEASVFELPAESQEAMAKIALAKGYHLCLMVSVAEVLDERLLAGQDGPPTPPPAAEPEPVKVELNCSATVVDARTGDAIGKAELVALSEAVDAEAAKADALERGGEELFEAAFGALVKSGWKLGETAAALDLRIGGLDSPAMAIELTSLLSSVAEFKKVELGQIEYRAAVWLISAVDPGNDWLSVLSRVKPSRGVLRWQAVRAEGRADAPTLIDGQWSAR